MSVEYKVHLVVPGQPDEISRIVINGICRYDYVFLRHKIASSFVVLNGCDFSLYWQDEEGDKIRIHSNEDLLVALNARVFSPVKKLYVIVKGLQDNLTNYLNSSGTIDFIASAQKNIKQIHTGVNCDGCQQKPLQGYRYKCAVCPDFDLCINCEKSEKIHSHHPMIRIPVPLNTGFRFGSALGNV